MRNRFTVLRHIYKREILAALTVGVFAGAVYGYAILRGVSLSNVTDMQLVKIHPNGDHVFTVLQDNGRVSVITINSQEKHTL